MPSPNNSLQGKQKQHHSFNDNKKLKEILQVCVCVYTVITNGLILYIALVKFS